MPKKADLSSFRVNAPELPANNHSDGASTTQKAERRQYITKGFKVTPEAAKQFDALRVELTEPGSGNSKGPELIAEALNLLFKKYGKPPIA